MIGKIFFHTSAAVLVIAASASPALAVQGTGVQVGHDATVTNTINGAVTQAVVGNGNKATQQIGGAYGDVSVGHDLTITTKINGAVTQAIIGNMNCGAQQIGSLSSNKGC